MTDSQPLHTLDEVERAIALTEAALLLCDEAGLIFPAIDLSSALEKLTALKEKFSEG